MWTIVSTVHTDRAKPSPCIWAGSGPLKKKN
jgi:hypothetical protein